MRGLSPVKGTSPGTKLLPRNELRTVGQLVQPLKPRNDRPRVAAGGKTLSNGPQRVARLHHHHRWAAWLISDRTAPRGTRAS